MPSMSIYFAYPGDLDSPTGGYRYDRRLVQELKGLGIDVVTLSLPHCAPVPSTQNLDTVARILADLPDQAVVVIDGLAFGVLDSQAAAEAQRLKLIALCHHPLALEAGLDPDLQQRLRASERKALAHARKTIVTSEPTKEILATQFDVPPEKILAAPPGTDPVPFASCQGDPARLLTVASLTRRKAHDLLIDALADLKDLAWEARFVGSGDFDPEWATKLHTLVAERGLAERIRFTGPVEDARTEFQEADLFVLPSRFEGYGMVFAEALAAGLPVIAARAGAVPKVVPESAGLLVPVDNRPALTDALLRVLTDAKCRQRLQNGAQQAAANLPRWSDTAAIVAGALKEVAQL